MLRHARQPLPDRSDEETLPTNTATPTPSLTY
jgi:hypothetical protein